MRNFNGTCLLSLPSFGTCGRQHRHTNIRLTEACCTRVAILSRTIAWRRQAQGLCEEKRWCNRERDGATVLHRDASACMTCSGVQSDLAAAVTTHSNTPMSTVVDKTFESRWPIPAIHRRLSPTIDGTQQPYAEPAPSPLGFSSAERKKNSASEHSSGEEPVANIVTWEGVAPVR